MDGDGSRMRMLEDFRKHQSFSRGFRGLGAIMLATAVAVALNPVSALAAPSRAQADKKTPVAASGQRAVAVHLPLAAQPRHGLPPGQLPPVEPAHLKVSAPPSGHAAGNAARVRPHTENNGPKATNVSLMPGLAVGDTSLIAAFDGPDTPWTQGVVTVYRAGDTANPVQEAVFTSEQAEAQACRQAAKYCWTLADHDGWTLAQGTKYVATVTLSAPDGSASAVPSAAAVSPRDLPTPPNIPDEQMRGTLGTGSGGRVDAQPATRGMGVNTATGAFTEHDTDVALQSAYPINIRGDRNYTSSDKTASLLGVGWSFEYDAHITPKTDGSGAVVFRAEDGAETTYTRQADGSYTAPTAAFSRLSANAGGGWLVVNPAQQRLTFDAAGKLQSVLDKRGKGVTLHYDGAGQLASLTDAGGRTVTTTVQSGRLASIRLPDYRTVTYTYAKDRLHTVRNPDGAVITYDYDGAGRLEKITDPLGHRQLTNAYDATTGRVVSQTDALGKVTRFEWDATKHESKVTDPDGAFVKDGYQGNVLQYSQNGNGDTTAHRSDAQGNTQVLTDPLGAQIEATHDGNGNTTSQTALNAGNRVEKSTFDDANNPQSFSDGKGNNTTFQFNAFNQPQQSTDALGNVTKFDYYPDTGLPHTITDPLGHVTTLVYDAAGNLTARTDANGATTTWTYDATGRQLSSTDPRGHVSGADQAKFTTTIAYDGEDRTVRTTDPLGHTRRWDFDNAGRLHAYTDANTFQSVYEYDNADRVTVEHDPDLRVVKHEYTDAGRPSKDVDGVGNVTSFTYDEAGRLKTATTPRGNVPGANKADFTTTYSYDANGQKVLDSRPNPAGGPPITVKYEYDALNHPIAVTDPLGRVTRTDFDEAGNQISRTDPLGNVSKTSYDGNNRPITQTDPLGHVTTTQYDAAGRAVATITPAGEKSTVAYDGVGRAISQVSPRGNAAGADPLQFTTRITRDAVGNVTAVTDPLGNTATATYDAVNNLTQKVDPNGHTTVYTFDAERRVLTIRAPDGSNANQVTTNIYDHAGHLITQTNPNGFATRHTYDAAGRPETVTDELGRIRQLSYDPDGNVVSTLTARATSTSDPAARAANTITAQYDIMDRLTNRTLGDGPSYSYGYDAASQVVSLADRAGQQSRGYDLAGRLTSVSRDGTSFGYSYDAASNLVNRTLPDGTTQAATFDADNRPATMTVPAGTAEYGYDPDSNLISTTLPGGSAEQRAYDNADRMSALTDLAPGGRPLSAYTLTRDKVGNVTRLDTTQAGVGHSDAFTYDKADRLTAMCFDTSTCSNAKQKLSYSYDLVGNRLTRTRTGTGAFNQKYTYDAANELTSSSGGPQGSVTYQYDADGNQTQAGKVKTTYDLDNQVASVDNNGRKTVYTEDAAGNRLFADTTQKGGGAATRTNYVWDVANPLPMLVSEQAGSTPARSYTYHPDGRPLTLSVNGATTLYRQDPFNNTADLTDLAGTILQQETMTDPFGEFDQSTPGGSGTPDPRFGFQGQYNDPLSDAYHMRARDYATGTGRFGSVEPLSASPGAPAESRYAFGDNNPLVNSDPSGKGCGILSGLCNAVSKAADTVKNAVTSTVNNVVDGAKAAVNKGTDLVKDAVADVKQKVNSVRKDVQDLGRKAVHNASDAVHTAAHWANQHKAQIAGIAAGVAAGAICEAVTAGAGSIGCAALAGSVGSMVEYGVGTPRDQWSFGGFAKAGVIGAATGALAGAAGKFLGDAAGSLGGRLLGKLGGRAEGVEGAAEGGAARSGERSVLDDMAGACSRNSFDPATLVLMADGTAKPIKDVKRGDQVAATDPATGASSAQRVTALHDNRDTELTDLIVSDGKGRPRVVHTTQHHPFWDETRGAWVDAAKLKRGDALRSTDGAKAEHVVAVNSFTGQHRMLNLTVNVVHTYYVMAGNSAVLVHNCGASDYLYRGVWPDHPQYAEALNGDAIPTGWGKAGPKLTPEEHNAGVKGLSDYTSWTSREAEATRRAQGGVVLKVPRNAYPTIESPDYFKEGEVLIYGPVRGAERLR
jgi:RHS repeat-associated protein